MFFSRFPVFSFSKASRYYQLIPLRVPNYINLVTTCIFLTSRIIGYNHRPLPVKNEADGPRRELRICAFEWGETEQFVTSWFRYGFAYSTQGFSDDPERGRRMLDELKTKISVWGMAANPLMATLLCLAYSPNPRRPPLTFPVQRGAVYERVLWGLLGEWRMQREKPEQIQLTDEEKKRYEDKLNLLAHIAWHFFRDGTERFSRTTLEGAVQTYLSTGDGDPLLYGEVMRLSQEQVARLNLLPDKAKQKGICREVTTLLCRELIEDDGVLAKDSEDDKETFYGFLHLTFQEYLTACHLAKRVNGESWETAAIEIEGKECPIKIKEIVDKKAWLLEWQEVILLLTGKLNQPARLLKLLADAKKDDYFRHRLALTAHCLMECRIPTQIAEGEISSPILVIADKVTTELFRLFCDFSTRSNFYSDIYFPHLGRALQALAQVNRQFGSFNMPLLSLLAIALREEDSDFRRSITWVIGQLGTFAATDEILSQLADLLKDGDEAVRDAAAWAVGDIGSVAATDEILSQLARLLKDEGEDDVAIWHAVGGIIPHISTSSVTDEILSRIVRLFREEGGNHRRYYAIAIVGYIGSVATDEILSQLVRLLRDKDMKVRRQAVLQFGRIDTSAATDEILSQLANSLRDEDSDVRYCAAWGVGKIGTSAATDEILSQLANLLKDEDEAVRDAAVNAVGNLGSAAATDENILSQLARLLKDEDEIVRLQAVEQFGRIGTSTDEILSQLANLLKDEDETVRRVAAAAKDRILSPRASLPRDGDRDVRLAAARALAAAEAFNGNGIRTSAAKDKILSLRARLLREGDRDVRLAAASAFSGIGSASAKDKILSLLASLLKDEDRDVCWCAARAVGNIGTSAATDEILSLLANLLRDGDGNVCNAAVSAVGEIGPSAATDEILSQIAILLEDSRDKDNIIRRDGATIVLPYVQTSDDICWAVREIGSAAATDEILSQLANLLRDGDGNVRNAAAEALSVMMQQGVRIFVRGKVLKAKMVTELAADP